MLCYDRTRAWRAREFCFPAHSSSETYLRVELKVFHERTLRAEATFSL